MSFIFLLQSRQYIIGSLPPWCHGEAPDYLWPDLTHLPRWAEKAIIAMDDGTCEFNEAMLLELAATQMDEDFIVVETWDTLMAFYSEHEAQEYEKRIKPSPYGFRILRVKIDGTR